MNPLTLFGAAALAHVLAMMSPGPDFAMVTRQTLAHGRSAGVWTALGIASGITFHVCWGMFGLGWLIAKVPSLLDLLRYAGALFLLVMGVIALRAQPQTGGALAPAQAGDWRKHFAIGVATNLLNPKAMLFIVALCSALLTTQAPLSLRIALALWIIASTAAWFSCVSFTLGHPAIRSKLIAKAHWIDRGMGMILLLLGAGMLLAGFYA